MIFSDSLRKTKTLVFFPPNRNAALSLILAVINSIFVLKYAGRIGFSFLAFVYFIGVLVVLKIFTSFNDRSKRFMDRKSFVAFLSLLSIIVLLSVCIFPNESRVARLPAISEWITLFLSGKFPYGGSMNPSGFPFLFFLAIPFYYLGNIGLLEAAGILIFGVTLLKKNEPEIKNDWVQLIVLLLLPSVYYEFITRSELFFNISLCLSLISVADSYLTDKVIDAKFLLIAIAFGLVLSTRLIVVPVFLIFLIYKFRRSFTYGIIFSMVGISVFMLTIIPFLICNASQFISHGPLKMQLAYLPKWEIFATVFASVILGFASKNFKDVSGFAGMTIFGVVSLAFLSAASQVGLAQVIFMDKFDVSYFILSVPLLLYSLELHPVAESVAPSGLCEIGN